MKKIIVLLLLVIAIAQISFNTPASDNKQAINPIIGDISFVEKFGHPPTAATDEHLRIATHLAYVENLLRHRQATALSPQLQQKRNHLLDLLHSYWTSGIFPRNYDYMKNRMPCFIDKNNRICAVGYLIEQTAGREIADKINSKHKYDRILAMNDETVNNWIAASGLSKEECAMIQPTYGGQPNNPISSANAYNYIKPGYGISSALLSGVNLAVNTLNGVQITKGTNYKTVAIAGLITGAGQTILGAANFPKTTSNFYGNTTNESKKTLSMVNIGLGTSTIILSAWNLITNKKVKDRKATLHITGFETPVSTTGMAFTLQCKL